MWKRLIQGIRTRVFVSRQMASLPWETKRIVTNAANIMGLGAFSFFVLPSILLFGPSILKTKSAETRRSEILVTGGLTLAMGTISALLARHATVGILTTTNVFGDPAALAKRPISAATDLSAFVCGRVYLRASVLTFAAMWLSLHLAEWMPIFSLFYGNKEEEKARRERAQNTDLKELSESLQALSKQEEELRTRKRPVDEKLRAFTIQTDDTYFKIFEAEDLQGEYESLLLLKELAEEGADEAAAIEEKLEKLKIICEKVEASKAELVRLSQEDGTLGPDFTKEEAETEYWRLKTLKAELSDQLDPLWKEQTALRAEIKTVTTVQNYSLWWHFSPTHWGANLAGGLGFYCTLSPLLLSKFFLVFSLVMMSPVLFIAGIYGIIPARFVVRNFIKVCLHAVAG